MNRQRKAPASDLRRGKSLRGHEPRRANEPSVQEGRLAVVSVSLNPLTDEGQIKAYYDARWKVLVLGDKNPYNPYRSDGKDWQKVHVMQEDAIKHHKGGGNIGLQMGEVSGWLCAVDLDYEEARRLAPQFLPNTLMGGKQNEALPSLYVYRSEGANYLRVGDGANE